MTPSPSALFVDLYELTMAQVYYEQGQTGPAVFELTLRDLPPGWRYLLAAGLERAIEFLESLAFTRDDLEYLGTLPQFDSGFIDRLAEFRFTGDVYAVAEGTAVYPFEPVLQVVAPLPEGQIVETALMNQLAFATLIASKAARVADAAGGKPLFEFGGRRAHGEHAALEAARAAYIGGFSATSSVEAGRRYGIPVVGTMAHSYILTYRDELDAMRRFASRYPRTTLLVDTYDTAQGVEHAITAGRELAPGSVGAIRIDSGDLAAAAFDARSRLDAAGLTDVQIIVSGGLDEEQIQNLVTTRAPIDAFACGTAVVTGGNVGALDAAYKLVEYEGRPLAKHSAHKLSLAGRKQVWRSAREDLIAPFGAPPPGDARPLLEPVMRGGERPRPAESLADLQDRARSERAAARAGRAVRIDPSLRELRHEPTAQHD